jgi:DNA polymerase-3 subunit epsilon
VVTRARTPSKTERIHARRDAIAWAEWVQQHPEAVFFDTETTGLDTWAEVVDVAVVDRNGATLFETLVRPDGPIPPDATRIHGIVDGMVSDAPRWPDVYPQLCAILDNRPVVVYNADFDFRVVNQMNLRCNLVPRLDRWHCAMLHYAAFTAEWNPKYGNYRYWKLDAALQNFGLPAAAHRARSDADACRRVVAAMAKG